MGIRFDKFDTERWYGAARMYSTRTVSAGCNLTTVESRYGNLGDTIKAHTYEVSHDYQYFDDTEDGNASDCHWCKGSGCTSCDGDSFAP